MGGVGCCSNPHGDGTQGFITKKLKKKGFKPEKKQVAPNFTQSQNLKHFISTHELDRLLNDLTISFYDGNRKGRIIPVDCTS